MQGIDANLQAKLPGAVAAEAAPAAKPVAATSGSKAVTTPSPATKQQGTMASMGRRLLLSPVVRRLHGITRDLLGRRGGADNGFNQMTANSIAATNTQQAINAAAEGNVPVSAATRYGSYQAQAAAEYGSDCWNCNNWAGR